MNRLPHPHLTRGGAFSEWTDESLIALRAMELANTSTSMCSVLAGVSPDQVTPILSICDWDFDDTNYAGYPGDAREVSALMKFAGGIIEEGISHSRMFAPIGACLRFPEGCDEKAVITLARDMGSAAQSELDRRWSEVHPSELS